MKKETPDKPEVSRLDVRANFAEIEKDCQERNMTVQQYFEENAQHLYKLYLKWKQGNLPDGRSEYDRRSF